MLSAAELAGMRDSMQGILPDVCTIQRGAVVSDGGGGITTTWQTYLADVPCRLSPVGGGEIGLTGARIEDEATSLVTMAWDVDVNETDRLLINGKVYDVQLVRRRASWALSLRVECKEADE